MNIYGKIMPTWIRQYKFLHKPVKPALTIRASHDLARHQNCLLENNMFRLLKALALTLALAALSFFATSCGSSSQSQVRVVHAIPHAPAVDINVNGTKVITNLAFDSFQPASGYLKVKAGRDTVPVFGTRTTPHIPTSTRP